jgi:integrase/recombinase XerC
LTPGRPSLYARDLGRLITLYLEDLDGAVQPATVDGYGYKLAYVLGWWAAYGPAHDWQLTQRSLEEFERWLRTQRTRRGGSLSYHSRNDILRRLRQLFRWAAHNEYVERDYGRWVPEAWGAPPLRKAADVSELRRLFDAAARQPMAARETAILAVLIGTGMRRSECASLRIEQIRLYADGSGTATVCGKRTRANASGERTVAFDAACGVYVRRLLDLEGRGSGPLFVGRQGPLTAQGIYKVVKRCIRQAGLDASLIACHDLRRAFATLIARQAQNEGDSDRLRRQLGHASYRMTAHYTLLDADDIRASLVSPLVWMMEEG